MTLPLDETREEAHTRTMTSSTKRSRFEVVAEFTTTGMEDDDESVTIPLDICEMFDELDAS